jgi:hypothetical protein
VWCAPRRLIRMTQLPKGGTGVTVLWTEGEREKEGLYSRRSRCPLPLSFVTRVLGFISGWRSEGDGSPD